MIIIANSTNIDIANLKSPFNADTTAQGTIAVPEPTKGNASTNPIPNATSNGYSMLKPKKFIASKPTKTIRKSIPININSAFK